MARYIVINTLKKSNTVNMLVLLKLMYRFDAIPIKLPVKFLVDIIKLILNFIRKGKGTSVTKTILKRRLKQD